MNRSAKGGARSSLHYGGEGILIHPPHQGVCGRHSREEQGLTSGGLAESPGGTGVSEPNLLNRPMRTRMYGGVAGEDGRPSPLCRF